MQRTILSFPFFALGYVFKDFKFLKTIDIKFIYQIIIALISCFILIIVYDYNGKVDIYNCKLGNPTLYYLGSFFGIIMMVFISNLLSKINLSYGIIKIYSNGTLVILGTHIFLLYIINKLLNYRIIFENDSIFKSIFVMIVLYYPIIFFLQKFPFLIGKINKK
jgi:predicted tellurium resistance membrane protein TerC